ncbi:hypothetical protein [Mycoplasma sp. 1654_15]|uniref:hypothetical protein n=1 Tax=Mycoplasma sp. 1654_15 TaxID=2725994 RepID=UPI00159B5180|nr:hypothetical protein [Mycoplasma sp. 1654_15]QKG28207.1 hypothetical protein HF996_03265 [Mycoplasma sp. 1654_15]
MILTDIDAKKYKKTAIHFFILSIVAYLAFAGILAYYVYAKVGGTEFASFIIEGIIVVGFLILFVVASAFFAGFYVYHKDLVKYKEQEQQRELIKEKLLEIPLSEEAEEVFNDDIQEENDEHQKEDTENLTLQTQE